MAAGSVNPFNLSDSDEESELRPIGTENGTPGPGIAPLQLRVEPEPATLVLPGGGGGGGGISTGIEAAPASPAAAGGGAEARLSVDAIAAQLLRDQYILTALELHTELLESGRELPRLRDYFSNPGNFERQSWTPPAAKEQGGTAGQLSEYICVAAVHLILPFV